MSTNKSGSPNMSNVSNKNNKVDNSKKLINMSSTYAERSNIKLNNKIVRLEKDLKVAECNIKCLNNKIQHDKKQNAFMDFMIGGNKRSATEDDNNKIKSHIKTLTSSIKEKDEIINQKDEIINDQKSKVTNLILSMKENNDKQKSTIVDINQQRDKVRETLESSINDLKSNIKKRDDSIDDLKSKIDFMKLSMDKMDNLMSSQKSQIETLTSSMKEKDTVINNNKAEIDVLSLSLKEKETNIVDFETQIEYLSSSLKAQEESISLSTLIDLYSEDINDSSESVARDDVQNETPVEVVVTASAETPAEVVVTASAETPAEVVVTAPAETPAETPAEVVVTTPAETPVEIKAKVEDTSNEILEAPSNHMMDYAPKGEILICDDYMKYDMGRKIYKDPSSSSAKQDNAGMEMSWTDMFEK